MDLWKIIGIGLTATIAAVIVRQHKPEFAIQIGLATGAIIMLMLMDEIAKTMQVFNEISTAIGADNDYIKVMLKITGIAYITEFGAQAAKDSGETGIASKIELGGKIAVMVLAAPLIGTLYKLLSKLIV